MEKSIQLYYRPQANGWDFVATRGAAFDAVLMPARYLAPYPEDHPSHGRPHDRLGSAAARADRPLRVDPDTPALCARAVLGEAGERLRLTAVAGTVDQLPLDPTSLRDPGRLRAFVDASLADQSAAQIKTAPYLDFRDVSDENFALNLRMARAVTAAVGPCAAVIQATEFRLLKGDLLHAAAPLANAGINEARIRIRGFQAERATALELDAYANLVEALNSAGIKVTPDCVGRLGPPLVALNASAFSTGDQFFRSVPRDLLTRGGGGGGQKLGFETGSGEVPRDEVNAASGRCTESGCVGFQFETLDDLRAHRLHTWRNQARHARSDPAGFAAQLRRSGNPVLTAWASVIERRLRRAA